MSERYVEVAVPAPVHRTFTYRVPAGVELGRGARVEVPFGRRRLIAIAMSAPTVTPPIGLPRDRIRAIGGMIDDAPILDEAQIALAEWMADYYLAPIGECVALLLPPRLGKRASGEIRRYAPKVVEIVRCVPDVPAPPRLGTRMAEALAWLGPRGEAPLAALRRATGVDREVVRRLEGRGLVAVDGREVARDPFGGVDVARDQAPALTAAQRAAVARIGAQMDGYAGVLLHGVTGSGKTEVYLALIERALAEGGGALILVPEIALTPQLVTRFRARLGDSVAVQHSGLDPEARHEQWLRIARGELRVVVGARSALFAPVRRLRLIVVDEEHEPSFKQEASPRYHARDLALVRGHLQGVPVVLGSATPSAESWANVDRGKLERISLAERVQGRPMPEVTLIDLRTAPTLGDDRLLSRSLHDALHATLDAGDQAILFLNRRGFANFVLCRACGERLECDACSVTLTWHRRRGRLVCHLCHTTRPLPGACPECGREALVEVGFGTEQVEARLAEALPGARVARMDRDSTRGNKLERLLTRFREGCLDVLVGTQMVAKGHDFPNVTLVGVLLAEQGLSFPDPRAAERTFQLLTQLGGRAGRAEKPGRVLVQTYLPEHYAVRHALSHDAIGFLREELPLRAARGFPPSAHMALFRIGGPRADRVEATAGRLSAAVADAAPDGVVVSPAQPAPIERVKRRFRFQVLIRASRRAALRRALVAARPFFAGDAADPGVQVSVDVDPMSFL